MLSSVLPGEYWGNVEDMRNQRDLALQEVEYLKSQQNLALHDMRNQRDSALQEVEYLKNQRNLALQDMGNQRDSALQEVMAAYAEIERLPRRADLMHVPVLDVLSENIQSLGRFVQMQDFCQHTGEGYVGGLINIYIDQARALDKLRRMLQTPSGTQQWLQGGGDWCEFAASENS